MVGPRNLLDVRSQAIVAAAEPELLGALAELDVRVDSATSLHGTRLGRRRPTRRRSVRAVRLGRARRRDRRESRPLQAPHLAALERDIVDLPAAPALRVEQLMIEDVEPEVDRLGQF